MSGKRITEKPGLFGVIYYYDENGDPIGQSRPGLRKGHRVYTDQNGKFIGESRPGLFAKEVFTDANNNQITSIEGLFGDIHFRNGMPIGSTHLGLFGTSYTTLDEKEAQEDFIEDVFSEDFFENTEKDEGEYDPLSDW